MQRMITGAVAIVGVLALMGAGCGSKTVVRQEGGGVRTTVESGDNRGSVTVEDAGTGAKTIIGNVGQPIPASFPSDVPQKPGAAFTGYTELQGDIITAAFQGPGTLAEWTSYYEQTFAQQGWTADPTYTVNNASLLTVKKDRRAMTITISADTSNPNTMIAGLLFGKTR